MTLLCHVSNYAQPGKGAGELPQSAPPEILAGLCPGLSTRHGTTCHEYQASRWLLQASEPEALCSNLHASTCGHFALKTRATST